MYYSTGTNIYFPAKDKPFKPRSVELAEEMVKKGYLYKKEPKKK